MKLGPLLMVFMLMGNFSFAQTNNITLQKTDGQLTAEKTQIQNEIKQKEDLHHRTRAGINNMQNPN